jgi:hypothetical protein
VAVVAVEGINRRMLEAPKAATEMASAAAMAITAHIKCQSDLHSRVGEAKLRKKPCIPLPVVRLAIGEVAPAGMTTKMKKRVPLLTRRT